MRLRRRHIEPPSIIVDPDCPKDTIYVVSPNTAGTLRNHPELVQHLAEGKRVMLTSDPNAPSAELVQEVRDAIQRVGRIDL